MDSGWRKNKYGGWFNINEYMNNKIRNIKDYNGDEDEFLINNQETIYQKNDVSREIQKVIGEYTSNNGYGSSEIVNGYLNESREMSDKVKEICQQNINLIDSCIKGELNETMYVYRGIPKSAEDLRVGKILENKGYTSTTLYSNDAEDFTRGYGTVIKLKVNKGTKALYIGEYTSNYKNEHELLIERGKSIKIIANEKVYDGNGNFIKNNVIGELI